MAGEPEAALEQLAQTGLDAAERGIQFLGTEAFRDDDVRFVSLLVLDQIAVEAVPARNWSLEADRVLDNVEQLVNALLRQLRLHGDLGDGRLAIQLLCERAARAHYPAHLVGDVHRQPDEPTLVGERPSHCLANPPGRVRRELVAHSVVELLHRPDQPEIAFLDEVKQRHTGCPVVPRDRHHEPEVAFDEAALGSLVPCVLAPGELAFLLTRQQPAVADLPHVELQWVTRCRDGWCSLLVLAELLRERGLVALVER